MYVQSWARTRTPKVPLLHKPNLQQRLVKSNRCLGKYLIHVVRDICRVWSAYFLSEPHGRQDSSYLTYLSVSLTTTVIGVAPGVPVAPTFPSFPNARRLGQATPFIKKLILAMCRFLSRSRHPLPVMFYHSSRVNSVTHRHLLHHRTRSTCQPSPNSIITGIIHPREPTLSRILISSRSHSQPSSFSFAVIPNSS